METTLHAARPGRLQVLAERAALCNALILAIAFALRAGAAFWLPQSILWDDGFRYVKVADILWFERNGWGGIYENWQSVPTQPLAIAGMFALFGRSFLALRLGFAAIGAFSCVLGAALARRLFGPVAGLLAGLLLAVYPHLVYLSALFEYPQTLFIFFMAAFLLLQYRYRASRRLPVLFFASLFLGLATITVPTILPFVPLFVLTLPGERFPRWLGRAIVVCIAVAMPLGTWATRNYLAYGELVLVNRSSGQVFWAGNNEDYYRYGRAAVAPACAPGYEQTRHCQENRELEARLAGRAGEGISVINEHEAESWRHGVEFIRASPSRFVLLTARKALEFWSPIPNAVAATDQKSIASRDVVSIVASVPILAVAVASMVLFASRWRELLPIYLYIASFWGLYSLFLPQMRYRLPLDFVMIVIAAGGVAEWLSRRAARRRPS